MSNIQSHVAAMLATHRHECWRVILGLVVEAADIIVGEACATTTVEVIGEVVVSRTGQGIDLAKG